MWDRSQAGTGRRKLGRMTGLLPTSESSPGELHVDQDGVDRGEIRAMLLLTPEERLSRLEEFLQSALEIRHLNEERPTL